MRAASAAAFDAGISAASEGEVWSTSSASGGAAAEGGPTQTTISPLRRVGGGIVFRQAGKRAGAHFLERLGQFAADGGTPRTSTSAIAARVSATRRGDSKNTSVAGTAFSSSSRVRRWSVLDRQEAGEQKSVGGQRRRR